MEFKHDDATALKRCDATSGVPSSGPSEPAISIDEAGIAELIAFFKVLAKWDQEAQTMKKCSNCGRPAVFSLNAIISTLGISKRLQESSAAVPFCDPCLHELCGRLCSDALSDCVNNALTTLNRRLRERATSAEHQERITDPRA